MPSEMGLVKMCCVGMDLFRTVAVGDGERLFESVIYEGDDHPVHGWCTVNCLWDHAVPNVCTCFPCSSSSVQELINGNY